MLARIRYEMSARPFLQNALDEQIFIKFGNLSSSVIK